MPIRRPNPWRLFAFSPFFPFLLLMFLPALEAAGHPASRPAKSCLEVSSRDFGLVQLGFEGSDNLEIRNRCGRAVTVFRVDGRPRVFYADLPSPLRIPAGAYQYVPIHFKPRDTSLVKGRFTVYSNAPRKPRVQAMVQGKGALPAAIAVDPASLERTLDPAANSTARISVHNPGGNHLEVIVDAKGGGLLRPEAGWKVLYLNTVLIGPWEDSFYMGLRSLGNVDTVERWDGSRSLPTLSRLLEYDMVLVASAHPWVDATAAGNLLADYVEAGGKVCLTASAMAVDPDPAFDRRLHGRMEEYFPLPPSPTTFAGHSGSLETHPITENIVSFFSESALDVRATQGQGQGIPLGTYEGGLLVGAYHPVSPVVALNIHTTVSGDVYALIANTLDYLGTSMAWMTPVFPPSMPYLMVPPGETRAFDVEFNTYRLQAGDYQGILELLHTGSEGPNPLEVPVSLQVLSKRCLQAEPDTLDFGKVWTGGRATAPLRLKNACNAPTRISAFVSDRPAFSVDAALPLEVPAFSHVVVEAAFAPTLIGSDLASLEIHSDADESPVTTAVLRGHSLAPPVLSFSPERLEATLAPGQTVARDLTLVNPGGDSLVVSLRPVAEAGAGSPGTGPEKLDVLFLNTMYEGDFQSDFMWNLRSLVNLASLTAFPAFQATPTLEQLRQFDVVLVVAGAPWADPTAVGNVLADFVDEGGRICLMHASLSSLPGWGLGGRMAGPEYAPMSGGGHGGTGFFASAEDHPIMEGITVDLYSTATMALTEVQGSWRPLGRFDNGVLIGAYSTMKPVVFVNIHPWDGDHSFQTISLLGNVFDHLADFHTWLQPDTRRIALAPGEEKQVAITMGLPHGPGPGTYQGRLELTHNAPDGENPLVVPASLRVEEGSETPATARSAESP